MPTLTVTTLLDDSSAVASDLTLREAVAAANPGDTIVFAAGLSGGTVALTDGQISISAEITIDGDVSGADNRADITIDAGGASRHFDVTGSGTLNLESMTLTGGHATLGGSIQVANGGTLTVDYATFTGNTSASQGGAIRTDGSTTITNSTFNGNTATSSGGAIYVSNNGVLDATNTTFIGNSATANGISTGGVGGGILIAFGGEANLINNTITGNDAGSGAGGLASYSSSGKVTLINTIVSGNTAASQANIRGNFTDTSGNVIGGNAADIFGTNTLADNGGPVQTIALKSDFSNPALDVGASAATTDARGEARHDAPSTGNDSNNFADAGAFEAQAADLPTPVTLSVSFEDPAINENGGTTTGTVTRSGDTTDALTVDLAGSDVTEAAVPATVTFAAGESTATFTVTGQDDALADGNVPVTITASTTTPGVVSGSADIVVMDDDAVNLTHVTTASDVVDPNDGLISLREAVSFARNGDTITFDSSLSTITLAGDIDISKTITIDGDHTGSDDKADITIDADGNAGIFDVLSGTLTLNSLTLTGSDGDSAVDVSAGATLNVSASTFTGNTTLSTGGSHGGGIDNRGTATIEGSTFTGNTAVTGGGIYSGKSTTLSVTNTTFTGNTTAFGGGGGVNSAGTGTFTNVTITDNTDTIGGVGGAGIAFRGTGNSVANSIISGNNGNAYTNVAGVFTDNGGNIIDGTVADIFGTNVLADNGGAVQTVALLNAASNPALDVGARTGPAANGQDAVDLVGTGNDGSNFGDAGAFELLCFAAGTLIATPGGERPVETLQIGDLVRTAEGREVPIRWIGRQTIEKRFARERAQLVRIAAGALGNHSDLYVTGDHGMMFFPTPAEARGGITRDGFVVNASALVNGDTVDWVPLSQTPARQTVYHIETEAHEVILANGALSETYLDLPGRQAFDNFSEFARLYGDGPSVVERAQPRITSSRLVPLALKARIRAAVPRVAAG